MKESSTKHGLLCMKIGLQKLGMTAPDYVRAHRHSIRHRNEKLSSERCGCFYCWTVFPPTEVKDWTDERDGIGQTALCPRCGIDAVIGSKSGYPITTKFLQLMRSHWFKVARNQIAKPTKETIETKQTRQTKQTQETQKTKQTK